MPPTLAARWMTTWAPSSAAKQAPRSRRSCSADRATFTSAPSSSSIATVGRPRKPAPPVTTTRLAAQNRESGLAAIGHEGIWRNTLAAMASSLQPAMGRLRVCIDARLGEGRFGGVEQVVIGIAAGLSKLEEGDEEFLFLSYPEHDDWLRPYLGGACRIVHARRGYLSRRIRAVSRGLMERLPGVG